MKRTALIILSEVCLGTGIAIMVFSIGVAIVETWGKSDGKTCMKYEKVTICAKNHQEYKVYEY